MKITTEIMNVIVNQRQVSNKDLIDMMFEVAKINNISIKTVNDDIRGFLINVINSIHNNTSEIIKKAKDSKF